MGCLKILKLGYLEKERQIFLRNKKVLNLCFRWKILRSYCFVAEVTFNILIHYQIFKGYLCYKTILSWIRWQKIDQAGRGSGLLVSLSLLSAQRNSKKRPYFLLPLELQILQIPKCLIWGTGRGTGTGTGTIT